MRRNPRRILLELGWYDYRLHRGIEQYAQEHRWHVCSDVTKGKVIPWGWEGDGILAWLGAGDDLAEFVVRARKPTVDFSFRRPQLPFPRVLVDHERCGRLAAGHFLTRGLTHFLFYSAADNWAFEENGRRFVSARQRLRVSELGLQQQHAPGRFSGRGAAGPGFAHHRGQLQACELPGRDPRQYAVVCQDLQSTNYPRRFYIITVP